MSLLSRTGVEFTDHLLLGKSRLQLVTTLGGVGSETENPVDSSVTEVP